MPTWIQILLTFFVAGVTGVLLEFTLFRLLTKASDPSVRVAYVLCANLLIPCVLPAAGLLGVLYFFWF